MTELRKTALPLIAAATALALSTFLAQPVLAHGGGTPRLAGENAGAYRVYAWSQPDPLRAGDTHLSVGITLPAEDASNGSAANAGQDEVPVTDAQVVVTYTPVHSDSAGDENGAGEPIVAHAQEQASLGTIYYETDVALPTPGLWTIEIAVSGPAGGGTVGFEADVAAARGMNTTTVAVVGAVIVVLLVALSVYARRRDAGSGDIRPEPRSRRNHRDVVETAPVKAN
jgi:hypothetical protein